MTPRRIALAVAAVATAAAVYFGFRPSEALPPARGGSMSGTIQVWSVEAGKLVTVDRVAKSDEAWRRQLTPEQFRVAREHGTEQAFTGATWDNHTRGLYRCAACGNDLFSSEAKYDSGTGWPSFWQPVHPANVGTTVDSSLFMRRVEVHCARCGAHLGHVFEDGPRPTGLRYCMNSAAMTFVPGK